MSARTKLLFGLTLLCVVLFPGLGKAALDSLGYQTVGTLVWAVGYGSGVLMIWYVWVRPVDLRAPESARIDSEE